MTLIEKAQAVAWNVLTSNFPEDTDFEILRKVVLSNLICLIGIFFVSLVGVVAFIHEEYLMLKIDIGVLMIAFSLISLLRRTQNVDFALGLANGLILFYFSFLLLQSHGNIKGWYWLFTYPLIAYYTLGIKVGTMMSFLLLAISIIIMSFYTPFSEAFAYDKYLVFRVLFIYLVISFFAIASEVVRAFFNLKINKLNQDLENRHQENVGLIDELKRNIDEVKVLKGMLPICAHCKKIRDDNGYWNKLETYLAVHTEAEFSHGMCPKCAKELYGIDYKESQKD